MLSMRCERTEARLLQCRLRAGCRGV